MLHIRLRDVEYEKKIIFVSEKEGKELLVRLNY